MEVVEYDWSLGAEISTFWTPDIESYEISNTFAQDGRRGEANRVRSDAEENSAIQDRQEDCDAGHRGKSEKYEGARGGEVESFEDIGRISACK